ncbi:hypothetical protein BC834DRAFT_966801 [Gloeopeniophorella convolvens]|nr:hypothetical protein BC834DRAFT_966801 [Gloeopeniophorella convolvens]
MTGIFLIGATGYIGGTLLVALCKAHPTLSIAALVRRPEYIDRIAAVGLNVTVLQGSFGDLELIEKHAREADIVINTADSDNVSLTNAILTGLRKRVEEDGKKQGALVHTSGSGVFSDSGREGKFDPEGKIWNDANVDDIRAITIDKLHGQVDVPILQAGEAGYAETHIISPGGIIGISDGPLPAGSVFIKYLIHLATLRRRPCYIGEGSNVLYLVGLDDLVDLFVRVVARILSGVDNDTSAYERYYLGVANAVSCKTLMELVGEALKRRGVLEDSAPESIKVEDLSREWQIFAASQRFQCDRARGLGWSPKAVDIAKHMDGAVDAVLQTMQRRL